MASLAEIRAKLKELESRSGTQGLSGSKPYPFAFWNMQEGQTATMRFLRRRPRQYVFPGKNV